MRDQYQRMTDEVWCHVRVWLDRYHSLVREFFVHSWISATGANEKRGEINDHPGKNAARIIVLCPDGQDHCAIEFACQGVSSYACQTECEVIPECEFHCDGRVTLKLDGDRVFVTAERVFVRVLGDEYRTRRLLCGYDVPDDAAGRAVTLEGGWRQCTECGDAWEENPRVEFSRCPSCGELTRLEVARDADGLSSQSGSR